jgi:cysteine desulfurase
MGADTSRARGSLRLSLGHTSTQADVDAVIQAIGPVTERARRAGMAATASSSPAPSADAASLDASPLDAQLAGRLR